MFGARTLSVLFSLGVASATLAASAPAFAQDAPAAAPKKPAKKKKPKPAEPAPETAPPPVEAPAPTPPPEPTPAPPPAESTAPATDTKPPSEDEYEPITDVEEKPAKTYHFIGARYRATVIPKFLMNAFVDEGTTIFEGANVGVELDIRRDEFSMIPWLVYSSYGTGNMLFRSKGDDASLAQNYSIVQSDLHAIYVGADVLWSKKIARNWDFEYGAGFGIGFLFGTLTNDWAYQDPNGILTAANGMTLSACPAGSDTSGDPKFASCQSGAHKNTTPAKVNNYAEKNWFNGGSVPTIFPHLSLPVLGLRYKPIKELEARASIGLSLTGFFFGFSVDYGLETREKVSGSSASPAPPAAAAAPSH
jgi:hypothetical protein